MVEYIREAYSELMNKVTWPTWSELQNSTTLVLVGSIIFSLLIYVMDQISSFVLSNYYNLF